MCSVDLVTVLGDMADLLFRFAVHAIAEAEQGEVLTAHAAARRDASQHGVLALLTQVFPRVDERDAFRVGTE
jgi:hypothetical protein